MCVHVCVCVYVTYVCTLSCMCARYVCTCVCRYPYMYVCSRACVSLCMLALFPCRRAWNEAMCMHVCYRVCVCKSVHNVCVCVCALVCMHCMCVCVVCLCNVQWNVHMRQHDHRCLHSQLDLCLNICILMTLYGSKVLDFCKLGFDFPYTYSKLGIQWKL